MQLHINTSRRFGQPLRTEDLGRFGPDVIAEVREYTAPMDFVVTPLHRMGALAHRLGISTLLLKDESGRSPLGSFKALGGAYAVVRVVMAEAERQLGRRVRAREIGDASIQEIGRAITVACATDGNHGRSVAAGAKLVGSQAVVFIHGGVTEARADAIRALGAEVRRVSGSYDESVAAANEEARRSGWQIISDTSWPGYEDIPALVMQGYLLMVDEVLQQLCESNVSLTHVFLQAGVGGFAAAVSAHLSATLGEAKPRVIIVEPERAACLFQSAIEQRPVRIKIGEPTIMAMLECHEPSLIAWRILESEAYAFVTIGEAAALRTLQLLAKPEVPDPFVLSGESGGAGVAALIEACAAPHQRELLGLDERSVVLAFNTEGATDPALYRRLLDEQVPA
jgi:diaminopropionate ammonia-lyase